MAHKKPACFTKNSHKQIKLILININIIFHYKQTLLNRTMYFVNSKTENNDEECCRTVMQQLCVSHYPVCQAVCSSPGARAATESALQAPARLAKLCCSRTQSRLLSRESPTRACVAVLPSLMTAGQYMLYV